MSEQTDSHKLFAVANGLDYLYMYSSIIIQKKIP